MKRILETHPHAYLPLLAILSGYWLYVMLSNILYAAGMNAGFEAMYGQHFAPWNARILQHTLLYPALVASVWASLKIGWRPLLFSVPMQLMVALGFSILGSPALTGALILLGQHEFKADSQDMNWMDWFDSSNLSLWLASATSMFLAYGFGLALVTGFLLYRRYAAAQLQMAALEREFSAARLSALRMQLSPHTLFNLLHAIHGQIGWDPKAAQSMIVKLGDLLRRLLRAGERDFSTLADEMQFVTLYLELQQQRFADRLSVQLPARDSLAVLWVPSLILQPLVENAVVHGLAGHDGAVSVRVEVRLDQDQLRLLVINTAVGVVVSNGEGIGLRNVRERLAVQFGDRASCSSRACDGGVWCAEVILPQLHDASLGAG